MVTIGVGEGYIAPGVPMIGGAEAFFTRWIPLEEAYIAATDPVSRCDLYLRGDPFD